MLNTHFENKTLMKTTAFITIALLTNLEYMETIHMNAGEIGCV